MLHGSDSFTYSRQTVLSLALHICLNPNMVKDTEADHALSLLKRIQMLANWQTTLAKASSCSFLFWNQELLSTFIQDVYKVPTEANRLQYICAAFMDARHLLRSVQHEHDNDMHLRGFKRAMIKTVEESLVKPLCRDVENDLRMRIHHKNQVPPSGQPPINI